MKKIIITIILIAGISQYVKSQETISTIIYTCSGRQVSARVLQPGTDDLDKAACRDELLDPSGVFYFLGIQEWDILDEATFSYNCHGYAWHLAQGYTNKVWINDYYYDENSGNYFPSHNIDAYWSTDMGNYACFVECSELEAEVIHYYEGDHSAVKSTYYTGKYESKWCEYPLVRHFPDQVPTDYQSNYRRYYKRVVPGISGSATLCGTDTFKITYGGISHNGPATSWNVTSGFSIVSYNATSAIVKTTAFNGQTGTLTAVVNGQNITKNIQACNSTINGNSTVCPGSPETFTLTDYPAGVIQWSVTGPYSTASIPGNPASVKVTNTGLSVNSGTLSASIGGTIVDSKVIAACQPVISGPTYLCRSGQAVFSVTNAPTGFTWGKSSDLNLSNSNSSSVTATPTSGPYTGVQAWVSINHNNVELIRKYIWIGYPDVQISGQDYVSYDGRYTSVNNPLSNATFFSWYMSELSPSSYDIYSYGSYADINFYANGTYLLYLEACNSCGCDYTSKVINVIGYSPGSYKVYPNPVNDFLNIEIDQQAIDNAKALYQSTTGAKYSPEPAFEFRLYNELGSSVRQTAANKSGIVQINVSNLPNGLYYLHINDGLNSKPEKQTIVVKH